MKKSTQVLLMIAGGMIALGVFMCTIIFFITGGNVGGYFNNTGWHKNGIAGSLVSEKKEFDQIQEIQIDSSTAKITIAPGNVSKVEIDYSYPSNRTPTVTGDNGTLSYISPNQNGWQLNLFGSSMSQGEEIIITYPEGMIFQRATVDSSLGDINVSDFAVSKRLNVNASLGEITLDGISAGELSIDNSCGSIELSGIKTGSLEIGASLGSIELTAVFSDKTAISNSSGQVRMTDSTLGRTEVDCTLGDITGNKISTSGLDVDSSSGSVKINGTLAGETEVDCTLGDVDITTTLAREDYSFDLETSLGDVIVGDEKHGREWETEGAKLNQISVSNSSGSIRVDFS